MTCRVIADFNFKEGEIGKIIEIGEGASQWFSSNKRL